MHCFLTDFVVLHLCNVLNAVSYMLDVFLSLTLLRFSPLTVFQLLTIEFQVLAVKPFEIKPDDPSDICKEMAQFN